MMATSEHHREAVALQKIELAHQYTMSLDVRDVNSDIYHGSTRDDSITMGLMVMNSGQEKRNFEIAATPSIKFDDHIESYIFQANEGRRYHWTVKNSDALPDRIVIELTYTDIEYLHQGVSNFTLIREKGTEHYKVTRGKYS